MPNLFRLVNDSPAKPVSEEPFENEAVFEEFVSDNPQLLGEDIKVIDKQVSCGDGRMDILAVDTSGEPSRVVIVELKNVPADTNVLLQTLRYASWVVQNEDSVRLMLQRKGLVEAGIEFAPIRIVVVAPEIRSALVDLSEYVVGAFEFDFVEIRRFKGQGGSFVTIDRPQSSSLSPTSIPDDPQEWTWDAYQTHKGWSSEQIELGRALFEMIKKKSKSKGWSLKDVFGKSYIVFKRGTRNVVGLQPYWSKGFSVWFKLHQRPEEGIGGHGSMQTHWEKWVKTYYVNIHDHNFDLDLLDDLFETAYASVAGEG